VRYPPAHRERLTELIHGRPVADPYRWLEDAAAPATRAWSRGQQALADAELGARPEGAVMHDLLAGFGGAIRAGPPRWGGDRAFLLSEESALMVRDPDGRTRVLADPAELGPSGTLEAFAPSPDGRLVAYQLSRGGTEDAELTVADASTGQIVFGPSGGVRHSPVGWLGSHGLYYVSYQARKAVLCWLDLGWLDLRWPDLAAGRQTAVLCGADPAVRFGLTVWHDRYLTLSVRRGTGRGTVRLLADLADGDPARPDLAEVRLGDGALLVGRDGRRYAGSVAGAPRGCLVTDLGRVVLDEYPDAVLSGVMLFDRDWPPRLLAAHRREGRTELNVHDARTGRRLHRVALPGDGAVTAMSAHPDGRPYCWLRYSDPVTSPRVLLADIRSGTVTGAAPDWRLDATVRRVSYPSADGTEVAMTMVIPDGVADAPTLLTAYGGFGQAIDTRFHPEAAAWVSAGGIWATASVRGGEDHGASWHEAGRGRNKPNAIADLHAAADWLVERGWTTRDRIALLGVSNGGLLAGAALVERPEAYAAVACVAPVLDMVRYERSGLGRQWRAEYGSADVPTELDWLLSYSPYHRVRPDRRYPPTLLVTFGGDTRVAAMHARKMCAALQHADTGGGPVLLHEIAGVGHGAKPGPRGAEIAATVLGFLARHTGLDAIDRGPRSPWV
jgi:prolyl oligopeptidase